MGSEQFDRRIRDFTISQSSLDFKMAAAKSWCMDTSYKGRRRFTWAANPVHCADMCRGKSKMFALATTEYGGRALCKVKNGIQMCLCYCVSSKSNTNSYECSNVGPSSTNNLYVFKTGMQDEFFTSVYVSMSIDNMFP